MITIDSLNVSFREKFNHEATLTVQSPGRINIIGEHTDYNNGFVLPAAIDKYIYIGLSKREDNQLNLYSEDYKEAYITDLNTTKTNAPDWAKYIIGVAQLIHKRTKLVTGFNLYLEGDVPLGAGLSSSAALSCATGFAINELFNLDLSRLEIALIGQQTEHEYIGLQCGIMDQFASVLGKENHAIKLDCRNLDYEYIPLDWADYEILLLNTNVKHNLASTAYNDRRHSCELGVQWIKEHYPEANSLRDITLEQLDAIVKPKDKEVYTKCRFIIEENQRVLDAVQALQNKDILLLGQLLFQAHWALSNEYAVSCEELDFLVAAAEKHESVVGARMMGGGFGGCTINLIKKGKMEEFIQDIAPAYKEKFYLELSPIKVKISNGTSRLFKNPIEASKSSTRDT